MNVLKTELKRGLCSWKFAGSVFLILLMGLSGAGGRAFLWQNLIFKWMVR